MNAVWKFPLRLAGGEQLCRTMPEGAIPIRFAMQGEVPTLWCLVNTLKPQADRHFAVVGTGHPIPDDYEYIGSADHGIFVWHAFECFADNGSAEQT